MDNDKCHNCPIKKKGQYLKNMVCKNNCPREKYQDPLDAKIIKLQQENLTQKQNHIMWFHKQVKELETRVKKTEMESDELGEQAEKGLETTIELIRLFESKFGIKVEIPKALQGAINNFINKHEIKRNKLNSFCLNGVEFQAQPIQMFTKINNTPSKLQ